MMKKTCLSTVMVAAFAMALTGCGASKLGNLAGSSNAPGAIASKLVWKDSKTTAKTAAAAPTGVTSIQVTVTGSDDTGKPIPVVRGSISTSTDAGTITGIFPGRVSLVVKAFTGSTVSYEGFLTGVPVTSGGTTTLADPIVMIPPTEKTVDQGCIACHETTLNGGSGQNIVAEFKQSGHYTSLTPFIGYSTALVGVKYAGCAGCHGKNHNVLDPSGAGRCVQCHTSIAGTNHTTTYLGGQTNVCSTCHNPHNPLGPFAGGDCVKCHAFPQDFTGRGNYVNDNSGVRAVMGEFSKRSHHIVGGTPHAAQCAVCHLEGISDGNGGVTIDVRYHMADNKIHLRNADTDADFAWGGTEHTNMDNFCFSCHDSNGATSAGIAAIMTGKNYGAAFSATNPFADTLTNGYDQVARTGVVDVKTAFTTTNASHHAVSGQRYKYRFSTRKNADMWAVANGHAAGFVPNSDIAEFHVGEASPNGGTIQAFNAADLYADKLATEEGGDATLFEGGKFVATYIPLGDTQSVADNSTLHCGDCHTVGQWKPGSSTNADGSATSVTIGAHGSANEYLLRNSLGTDAIHNSLTYVCFNCHKTSLEASSLTLWAEKVADGLILPSTSVTGGTYQNTADGNAGVTVPVNYTGTPIPTWKAGWGSLHPVVLAGQVSGYATAHAVSAMHIQCIADSADNIGATDRQAKSWMASAVKVYDYVPAAGATATAPTTATDSLSGNITGIGCTNCHNSGLRSGFGGIHGGNNTYTDGLGRTQTTYRFMPGMGNYRYAPPGGWDGHDVSDPTLLTANNPQTYGGPSNGASSGYPGTSGKPMGGCYTNGTADLNPGYSTCSHHGTSTAQPTASAGARTTRSGATANFRTTYGGGTTGSPTTYEPTVREATAGGTLVTRPLKY